MNKILIGLIVGISILTVLVLFLLYIEDGAVVTARDENNDKEPIQLIAVCEGENTKLVSCTWIPLEESKRTEAEQALAERAEQE